MSRPLGFAWKWMAAFFVYALLLLLSFNRHSKSGIYTYHSEIWADKAGYHVYLPATFLYNFEADKFPADVDKKTGSGYSLFLHNNKVSTKYTYVVAFLQSPFFLGAHVLAKPLGYTADGYSLIYHRATDVAAVTYFFFGLVLLYSFLRRRFNRGPVLLSLTFVSLGTNLLYYSAWETGMSHVYSFFLCSWLIYFSDKFKGGGFQALLIGALVGLLVVMRFTNLVLVAGLFLLFYRNRILWFSWKGVKNMTAILGAALLMFVPQLLYYNYLSGSYFHYPYGEEGFNNWMKPHVAEVLLAPNNGLILYSPMFIMLAVSLFYNKKVSSSYRWICGLIIATVVYFSASWWTWPFGCSLGMRNMIEYFPLMLIPFAGFLSIDFDKFYSRLIYFGMIVMVVLALKLSFTFDGCFYGKHHWDWNAYFHLITSETK